MGISAAQFRRWRWALLLVFFVFFVLLTGAVNCLTFPLHESDKAEAARLLVAWIVEGRSLPGFGEEYPDAKRMPGMKRFFVICDFLPADVLLSNHPRVQRISRNEFDSAFEKHGFKDTDYIFIELKSESGMELMVEFENGFGGLAGHGYRFEFRRKVWGLRATGKLLWVA